MLYTEGSAFFALRRTILSQRTFSIIKPDAVRKGVTAAILAQIEKAGFKIVAIKRASISRAQAEGFYAVHAGKPFFAGLTEFMSSGPIFPMVLEKENAIADLRKLMGATNPAQAEEERSAKSMRSRSARTRSTARTARRRRRLRLVTGLRGMS